MAVASRAVTTVAGSALTTGSTDGVGSAARFANPRAVAVDGTGNLYVADTSNGTIRQIALASQSVTTLVGVAGKHGVQPGPLPGALNQPAGIAASPAGLVYVTDLFENAVLEVR